MKKEPKDHPKVKEILDQHKPILGNASNCFESLI